MNYEDRSLRCADCGSAFAFSAGRQELYNELGFTVPLRCRACLGTREAARR